MRVLVTGTPGTGKTTATERADLELEVVHLNDVIEEEGLYDEVDQERESRIANLDALEEWADGLDDCILESHLAHHLPGDRVVVLRCHPAELEERLAHRDESQASVEENAMSEALDVILAEAVERHGEANVYEIDTTDSPPETVAEAIGDVVQDRREPSAGTVDFTDYV